MNWNRVLNVMILIFLVMNIAIFGYSVIKEDDTYVLTKERQAQLEELLKSNGITMYNFYPAYEPMAAYTVTVPEYNKTAILNRIFDGNAYNSERVIGEDGIYEFYYHGDETMVFREGNYAGMIQYNGPGYLYQTVSYELEHVIALGKEFAEDLIDELVPLDLASTYYDDETETYHLLFNEMDDEDNMFCNYVKLVISEAGVLEASASIYPRLEKVGNKVEVYPIDEVLYTWMSEVAVNTDEPSIIKKIELGYDLGIDELGKDASIEVVPHYRMIMHNGIVYEINAYTNEIKP